MDGAAATCCCDSRHASPPSDARPSSASCDAASRKRSTGSTGPRLAPPDRSPRMSVRKAVFPAAGLGTRFLPATKAQPKEMLPL
ncbi:MAG: hypothetical protein ABW216_03080, partial [Candidatus Rokuibacteriota bacterium]